jgi:formylglycine-generating enzyme required for sulfatase activity
MAELVKRLAAKGAKISRYRVEGEFARGGMGLILKVWDEDLRRHLAMKVLRDRSEMEAHPDAEPVQVARFLEEAQVTGQLDHPGIVPVHELGLDEHGRVYFTMKLVKGRDLRRIFRLVFDEQESWNETRALSVLLKVCEAVAYAHKKGVIHRDLKPANVMVGNFGEVYVMDWGLARVSGHRDSHDIRVQPASVDDPTPVRTARRDAREDEPDSPIVTMDGDIVGTPAYMAPEQARGEIEQISWRADVYSIGAMMYHLLARHMPYVPAGMRVSGHTTLGRVLLGPPAPLASLRPDIPAELVAICEKAMAREASARYADTLELADDLRAYLERRVVKAYETGAVAELRKWFARNKPLALAVAIAIVVAMGLLAWVSIANVALSAAKTKSEENAKLATQRADDVLALSAIQDLQDLVERARTLWPPIPANIARFDAWLRDANALIAGHPADPTRDVKARPGLADHRRKLAELRERALPGETATFADAEDRWWHAQLEKLIRDLEAFSEPSTGLLSSGISREHGWGVEKRAAFARTIERDSVTGPDAAKRWSESIASIRDERECPLYGGFELAPQIGLLPIGRDPKSGLWEFAHLQSGKAPARDANGALVRADDTCVVLVLVPGGAFAMGAQSTAEADENHDPMATPLEGPVKRVELEPFFLSKLELTQAQWIALTGANPSSYYPGVAFGGKAATLQNPVENVSFDACERVLAQAGLVLPTEAQWEYAARAGTSTPWWTGGTRDTLRGAANLTDEFCRANGGPTFWGYEDGLDDGWTTHAPVGSFRANAFGLHDVCGNVFEWCRDFFGKYSEPVSEGDGERQNGDPRKRVARGGSFENNTAFHARSSNRNADAPDLATDNTGARPARRIER